MDDSLADKVYVKHMKLNNLGHVEVIFSNCERFHYDNKSLKQWKAMPNHSLA